LQSLGTGQKDFAIVTLCYLESNRTVAGGKKKGRNSLLFNMLFHVLFGSRHRQRSGCKIAGVPAAFFRCSVCTFLQPYNGKILNGMNIIMVCCMLLCITATAQRQNGRNSSLQYICILQPHSGKCNIFNSVHVTAEQYRGSIRRVKPELVIPPPPFPSKQPTHLPVLLWQ
jgi:hypothetical protein